MTGDIGKEVCDERIRRNMRQLIAYKGRMIITTFDLVDLEAVDKMIDNPPQQFCLWVTKHVSKVLGQKK